MTRFFAHLKIKQDIQKATLSKSQPLWDRAKSLALANNFVTDLTSLVVVLPERRLSTTTKRKLKLNRKRKLKRKRRKCKNKHKCKRKRNRKLKRKSKSKSNGKRKQWQYSFFTPGGGGDSPGSNVPVLQGELAPVWKVPASPCNISLYSEDWYSGESINLSQDTPDLAVWDFAENLVSLKVEGGCEWRIFTGQTLSLSLSLSIYF